MRIRSWKTSLAGVSLLLTGIVQIVNGEMNESTLATILAGIGLLVAKDGNVSHTQP